MGDVRAHSFLGANVEWDLLASRKLMAPFLFFENYAKSTDPAAVKYVGYSVNHQPNGFNQSTLLVRQPWFHLIN